EASHSDRAQSDRVQSERAQSEPSQPEPQPQPSVPQLRAVPPPVPPHSQSEQSEPQAPQVQQLNPVAATPVPVPVVAMPTPTVPVTAPSGMSDAYAEEHARRYARLLIADIRLYNEAAVRTGREQRDLAHRLQPEIARARHAFEERVP